LAFADPSLYLLWFMQLSLNTSASFTNFFPTIVKTLGYNKTQTLLLSAPPYVFAAILGITNSWHSDKTRERWLHVVWPQVFCSIGFIISATTLNTGARYTATFMMMSVYGSFGCILSWVSSTLPRPSSKRAVAYAVVNAGSNLASIYASCKSAQVETYQMTFWLPCRFYYLYQAHANYILTSRLLPSVPRTTILAG
jgi:hypothetical protein